MISREAFTGALDMLCMVFRVEAGVGLYEGYWLGCADLSDAEFKEACNRALASCKHMPRPVELIDIVRGSNAEASAVAFDLLRKTIGAKGSYVSVDFVSDPALNATVRALGGWVEVCGTDAEKFETYFRRDFERLYAVWRDTAITEQHAALPGRIAASHIAQGLEPPEPQRIGTPQQPALTAGNTMEATWAENKAST